MRGTQAKRIRRFARAAMPTSLSLDATYAVVPGTGRVKQFDTRIPQTAADGTVSTVKVAITTCTFQLANTCMKWAYVRAKNAWRKYPDVRSLIRGY